MNGRQGEKSYDQRMSDLGLFSLIEVDLRETFKVGGGDTGPQTKRVELNLEEANARSKCVKLKHSGKIECRGLNPVLLKLKWSEIKLTDH